MSVQCVNIKVYHNLYYTHNQIRINSLTLLSLAENRAKQAYKFTQLIIYIITDTFFVNQLIIKALMLFFLLYELWETVINIFPSFFLF